jgi:alkylhydroperoxidase family enzyme
VWNAVARDWRSAPVSPQLGATLAFLEKMTLAPDELDDVDRERVRAAGVSDEALIDAIHVCALFNMIVRLADALGWEVPPLEAFAARAPVLLENGYALPTLEQLSARR